jgi:D-galactonate transporter
VLALCCHWNFGFLVIFQGGSILHALKVTTDIVLDEAELIYSKVAWRIVPLVFLCYIFAYLDRVNVGFARLQMLTDLKFSETAYGVGAGIFFVGYFIFEVPSNLVLQKVGARLWIARIMITWGIISAAMMLVRTPVHFYILRFLLGAAEAGFYPGVVLYFTYWFPSRRRGRIMALFFTGNPISGIIGGPVSGSILQFFGGFLRLAGWQWLFLLEALPTIILGFLIYFILDDHVADAKWLTPQEKAYLDTQTAAEAKGKTHHSLSSVFGSGRVWLLCLIMFGTIMGSYAYGFWLPAIIKQAHVTQPLHIGLLTMIPYVCAVGFLLLSGWHGDKTRERRWHVAGPQCMAAVGFILCGAFRDNAYLAIFGLTLCVCGVITASALFWSLPTSFLGGTAAAAGIAFINATGSLGGFFSPIIIGWLKDYTNSLSSGLYLVAGCLLLSAVLNLTFIPAKLVNR